MTIGGGVLLALPLAHVHVVKPLILFVCSAKLWLTLRNHRNRSYHDNDDDDDDDDARGGIGLGAWSKSYPRHDSIIYRRDTSLDFHPNNTNSNWTHFETNEPQLRSSLSSKDSYSDNILRGKDSHHRRFNNLSSTHSNAQRCLPSKLILIRHGQSEGNVDESLYATKPDNAMGLTKLGWEMARMAGKALRGDAENEGLLPPGESVHFIVSPYVRTVETFHGIASAWIDPEEMDLEEGEKELLAVDSNGLPRNNTTIASDENISSSMKRSKSNNIINDYNGSYHNTSTCSSDHHNSSSFSNNSHINYNTHRCKRLKLWYKQLMKIGLTWHEDPRIREQDCKLCVREEHLLSFLFRSGDRVCHIFLHLSFTRRYFVRKLTVGNYQDPKVIQRCKAERHKFGSFYYRYPHGESASDVVCVCFFASVKTLPIMMCVVVVVVTLEWNRRS